MRTVGEGTGARSISQFSRTSSKVISRALGAPLEKPARTQLLDHQNTNLCAASRVHQRIDHRLEQTLANPFAIVDAAYEHGIHDGRRSHHSEQSAADPQAALEARVVHR